MSYISANFFKIDEKCEKKCNARSKPVQSSCLRRIEIDQWRALFTLALVRLRVTSTPFSKLFFSRVFTTPYIAQICTFQNINLILFTSNLICYFHRSIYRSVADDNIPSLQQVSSGNMENFVNDVVLLAMARWEFLLSFMNFKLLTTSLCLRSLKKINNCLLLFTVKV